MRARLLYGIAALTFLAPAPVAAQNATVRTSLGNAASVAPGGTLDVPIVLDVSGATGLSVASLTVKVAWDPARLTLGSVGPGTFGSLTNTSGSGQATLVTASAIAATGVVTLATLRFQAAPQSGASPVSLGVQAAGDAQGQSVRDRVGAQSLAVCVGTGGALWGDVNGDAQVDILDAQQIARYVVGLSVADQARVTSAGDVNGDAQVDILDAQQIARYVVGLSASTRIAQQAPGACGALGAVAAVRVTPSSPLVATGGSTTLQAAALDASGAQLPGRAFTWSSSASAVATVDASGIVRAVGVGSATITATSEGVSGTATVATGQPVPYSIVVSGQGDGVVVSDVPGINCQVSNSVLSGSCTAAIQSLTIPVLSAIPAPKFAFDRWTGSCSGSGTCAVVAGQTFYPNARFKRVVGPFTLSLVNNGDGDGTITSQPAGIDCRFSSGVAQGPSCSFAFPTGTSVKLTGSAPVYPTLFSGFFGDCASATTDCTVVMDGDKAVTTTYKIQRYSLLVAGDGSSTARGTVKGGGLRGTAIDCRVSGGGPGSGNCEFKFPGNTVVTLTAIPDLWGSQFTGWMGNCQGSKTAPTCTIQMTQAEIVLPSFVSIPIALVHLAFSGSGNGNILHPSGACIKAAQYPADCDLTFNLNQTVTFQAQPLDNGKFGGWLDDATGCGTNPVCTLKLTKTVMRITVRID